MRFCRIVFRKIQNADPLANHVQDARCKRSTHRCASDPWATDDNTGSERTCSETMPRKPTYHTNQVPNRRCILISVTSCRTDRSVSSIRLIQSSSSDMDAYTKGKPKHFCISSCAFYKRDLVPSTQEKFGTNLSEPSVYETSIVSSCKVCSIESKASFPISGTTRPIGSEFR